MDREQKVSAMQDRGIECLETFREGFLPEARDQYRLTIVARNAAHPDGSRDLIVTSDTGEGIRAALNFRFPENPSA